MLCFKVEPQGHVVPDGALVKVLLRDEMWLYLWHTRRKITSEIKCVGVHILCLSCCFYTGVFQGWSFFNPSMRDVWNQRYLKSFPASLYLGQHLTARISPDILVFEQSLNLGTFLISFPVFLILVNMRSACSDTQDLHVHFLTVQDVHDIHKWECTLAWLVTLHSVQHADLRSCL